jgi:ABC-type glycerol-3-phosphate transport system substrate-binding protein
MLIRARKTASTLAIIAAAGLGGSALAGAASSGSTSTTITTASKSRTALSAENAAKVKAAALAKVPGATVDRVSSGGSYATPYHAHITTSGGTKQVVLVDASFNATTVQADTGRGGKGGGRDGRGETALTGARSRPR